MNWKTSRRTLSFERPLVMGILNVTPDSFSDGGAYSSVDEVLTRVEQMVADGVDVIDIGGESTRPGSSRVSASEEAERVVPVIEAIVERFEIPVSIDTSKAEVAAVAVNLGAEIINDISGLRWDAQIAEVAAKYGAGLILMHSRGEFETMHTQQPVDDILADVAADFHRSVSLAKSTGVADEQIALDIGIGFGKSLEQNLELIAKLDKLVSEFAGYPILVGTSRKSFIGKLLGGAPVDQRLAGSLATVAVAVWNGAKIFRVHDVKESVDAVKAVVALRGES